MLSSDSGLRQREATKPITVTSTKKKIKTDRATGLISVVILHPPIADVGQKRGQRHPGELVPIEEGEPEKLRVVMVVEGHPEEPDIGEQQQPKHCPPAQSRFQKRH